MLDIQIPTPGHPGVGVINQDLVSPGDMDGYYCSWIGLMLTAWKCWTWIN